MPTARQLRQERGLTLSLTKTQITPITTGFDFLGQTVRKYQDTLLITPVKANVKAFLAKVREIIKANDSATAGNLIAQGGRHWVFSGEVSNARGEMQDVALRFAARTPIRYHVKIKGAANPYDSAWEPYFEHRLGVKMAGELKGRRQLLQTRLRIKTHTVRVSLAREGFSRIRCAARRAARGNHRARIGHNPQKSLKNVNKGTPKNLFQIGSSKVVFD